MKPTVLAALLAVIGLAFAAQNLRPTIAVFSQPIDNDDLAKGSYLATSYVDWIESGGARAVLIEWDAPTEEHDEILKQVNGVLLPGGDADIHTGKPYNMALKHVVESAKATGTKGVWGTCLGFQALMTIENDNNSDVITGNFTTLNEVMALSPTTDWKGSRFVEAAGSEVAEIFETQNVTSNYHHDGLLAGNFFSSRALNSQYKVLSVNMDAAGKEFVSTVEHKKLPFFATQWHPEKAQFEWNTGHAAGMNHSSDSIRANSFTARFFVDAIRGDQAQLTDESRLFKHYDAIVDPSFPYFESIYKFPARK